MWKPVYFINKCIEGIHQNFYEENQSKVYKDMKKIRKKSGKSLETIRKQSGKKLYKKFGQTNEI